MNLYNHFKASTHSYLVNFSITLFQHLTSGPLVSARTDWLSVLLLTLSSAEQDMTKADTSANSSTCTACI